MVNVSCIVVVDGLIGVFANQDLCNGLYIVEVLHVVVIDIDNADDICVMLGRCPKLPNGVCPVGEVVVNETVAGHAQVVVAFGGLTDVEVVAGPGTSRSWCADKLITCQTILVVGNWCPIVTCSVVGNRPIEAAEIGIVVVELNLGTVFGYLPGDGRSSLADIGSIGSVGKSDETVGYLII